MEPRSITGFRIDVGRGGLRQWRLRRTKAGKLFFFAKKKQKTFSF
jgi:hypothetical protein